MAIVQNTLIGKSSGSVGGTTFTTWKGKNVLKSKAVVVANPRKPKQVARRDVFTTLLSWFRLIASVVNVGFIEMAKGMSSYNAFMSYNLLYGWDWTDLEDPVYTPDAFIISKGSIASTPITTVVADISDGTVEFTFPTTATLPGQSLTDLVICAARNGDKDVWTCAVSSTARSTGTYALTLPAGTENGDTIECYLGFINIEGTKASDSYFEHTSAIA
jgi:hypothetical protein